jgi:predicted YcjX-like family ATPase
VLVDALSAVNGGADALRDLQANLEAVLKCFRPGANTWLSSILARRVDRLVFAATKADHLHHSSHDRLEAILRLLVEGAMARAAFAGAEVKAMALAAVRATREAEARSGRQLLPCIIGVPLPGERVDRKTFDGKREAALFPGDLPEAPENLESFADMSQGGSKGVQFVRFRPPRIAIDAPGAEPVLPHIRLDRAIHFLFGDRLA